MIGIYRIVNKKNGKSYIGQSVNINKRFREHCCRNEQYIDKSIRKYGKESFDFIILEECEPEKLNEREDY